MIVIYEATICACMSLMLICRGMRKGSVRTTPNFYGRTSERPKSFAEWGARVAACSLASHNRSVWGCREVTAVSCRGNSRDSLKCALYVMIILTDVVGSPWQPPHMSSMKWLGCLFRCNSNGLDQSTGRSWPPWGLPHKASVKGNHSRTRRASARGESDNFTSGLSRNHTEGFQPSISLSAQHKILLITANTQRSAFGRVRIDVFKSIPQIVLVKRVWTNVFSSCRLLEEV